MPCVSVPLLWASAHGDMGPRAPRWIVSGIQLPMLETQATMMRLRRSTLVLAGMWIGCMGRAATCIMQQHIAGLRVGISGRVRVEGQFCFESTVWISCYCVKLVAGASTRPSTCGVDRSPVSNTRVTAMRVTLTWGYGCFQPRGIQRALRLKLERVYRTSLHQYLCPFCSERPTVSRRVPTGDRHPHVKQQSSYWFLRLLTQS